MTQNIHVYTENILTYWMKHMNCQHEHFNFCKIILYLNIFVPALFPCTFKTQHRRSYTQHHSTVQYIAKRDFSHENHAVNWQPWHRQDTNIRFTVFSQPIRLFQVSATLVHLEGVSPLRPNKTNRNKTQQDLKHRSHLWGGLLKPHSTFLNTKQFQVFALVTLENRTQEWLGHPVVSNHLFFTPTLLPFSYSSSSSSTTQIRTLPSRTRTSPGRRTRRTWRSSWEWVQNPPWWRASEARPWRVHESPQGSGPGSDAAWPSWLHPWEHT